MRAILALALSAMLLVGASPPPRVAPQDCDLSGVVQLFVRRDEDRWASGTGFAIAQGILTNAHMAVSPDGAVQVAPNGAPDKTFPSRFLAVDAGTDLALVELPIDLAVTPLAPTAWVPQGTAVRIVGFPGPIRGSASMTQGIVSKVWHDDEMGVRVLTDAAVNPGNSGSPILGNDCAALGIVHARYEGFFSPIQGMGLGVGADTIRAFLDIVESADAGE